MVWCIYEELGVPVLGWVANGVNFYASCSVVPYTIDDVGLKFATTITILADKACHIVTLTVAILDKICPLVFYTSFFWQFWNAAVSGIYQCRSLWDFNID